MDNDQNELIWQRLSKALFGGDRTTDEGLFTYRVMEQVRRVESALEDVAWHRFLRWAVPMLGAGVASLILAARTPARTASPSIESAVFQLSAFDEDPLTPVLENF